MTNKEILQIKNDYALIQGYDNWTDILQSKNGCVIQLDLLITGVMKAIEEQVLLENDL